jgi:hypothetical protein
MRKENIRGVKNVSKFGFYANVAASWAPINKVTIVLSRTTTIANSVKTALSEICMFIRGLFTTLSLF